MLFLDVLRSFSLVRVPSWMPVGVWAALLLLVPLAAPGQTVSTGASSDAGQGDVQWDAEAQPEPVRPGEPLMVELRGEVTDGWYSYALNSPAGKPLSVTFDALPEGLTVQNFVLHV